MFNRREFMKGITIATIGLFILSIGGPQALSSTREEKLKKIGLGLKERFEGQVRVEPVLDAKRRVRGALNSLSYYIYEPAPEISLECVLSQITLAQKAVEKAYLEMRVRKILLALEDELPQIKEQYKPRLIEKTNLGDQLWEAGLSDEDISFFIHAPSLEGLDIVLNGSDLRSVLEKSYERDWAKGIKDKIEKTKPSLVSHIGAAARSLVGALEVLGGVSSLFTGSLPPYVAVASMGHGVHHICKEVEHFS